MMVTLNEAQRREVFDKVLATIDRKFMGSEPDIKALREKSSEAGARSPSWWLAASAALLLLIAAGIWFYFYAGSPPGDRTRSPVMAEADVRIDLRPYAVARSEQRPVGLLPIALSSQRLRMTVLLPAGSEPGPYALRLLDSSSREVISATATAEIRDFVTTLLTTVDLRSIPAGEYQLGVRREGEDWHSYPVSVK
jgi:hypothetical protein